MILLAIDTLALTGLLPSELHFVLCSIGSYLPSKRSLEL